MEFSSEGFDLDALAATDDDNASNDNKDDDNVVYEIGGGVSRIPQNNNASAAKEKDAETKKDDDTKNQKNDSASTSIPGPTWQSDTFKQQGNDAFCVGEYSEAVHLYSAAIDATPGPKSFGVDLLKLRDAWKRDEQARARRNLQQQEEKRRREQQREREQAKEGGGIASSSPTTEKDNELDDKEEEEEPAKPFETPSHPHAEQLAIYHCNRAAALLQLYDSEQKNNTATTTNDNDTDDDDDQTKKKHKHLIQALDDCDVALLLHPQYIKALVRRGTVHERMDHTDLALQDAKDALALDPTNTKYKRNVQRLEKVEQERLDKLKTETMDKLKDLGNSILGNFGLSLDNFKAVQDPKTGSYNISFDQSGSSASGGGS